MSADKNSNVFYKHPVSAGVLAFIVVFIISQSLTVQRYLLNLSEYEKENTEELNRVVDQLQFNLNYALSTTQTLAFIVENYGMPDEFDSIARKLLEANDLIDGIQLVEKGVITKMHPLEGNEVVIGYDIVADSTRNKEVLIAAEKGQMYFGGPFELKQGGMGIVGRVPLKVEQDSLAFAAVVIRLEKLIEVSGISGENDRFQYQLSKINPDTGQLEYFLRSKEDFTESQVASVHVPFGEWQIYVKEKNVYHYKSILPLAFLALILSALGGFLTWLVVKRPAELQQQVTLQTKMIFGKERRYRALVEKSNDAVVILSPEGKPSYVSPSITTVLGYEETAAYKLNFLRLLHPDDKAFVTRQIENTLKNPEDPIKGQEIRILHKDGTWRWIESTYTNMLEDPDVKGIVNNFRDITEKRSAEQTVLKGKQLSEAIINSLPGIFYLFNTEGRFLVWNKNFEVVSGYSAKEVKKMHPLDFFEGEDIAHIQERIDETFKKGESFAEAYFLTKSGKKIYHFFTGSTIEYKGETCLLGTGIDTSMRRKAEIELKQSEEQLLSIFNNSISAVIMMDSDGLITNWNARAEQLFGWTTQEVINKPMHHFIMPDEHKEAHLKGMEEYKKTGTGKIINSNIEITAITKGKTQIDISLGVTTVTIRGKEYFISFINDITQRKQAERSKKFEEQNREALINSTEDLIWSVSNKMTLIAANKPFKESYKNYIGNEITEGDSILPFDELDKDYVEFWEKSYNRALNGEKFTVENKVPANKVQEEQTLETSFHPIMDQNKIRGVACSSRNITERIKNQEEIKEFNEKLKTAQEIGKLGYWEYIQGEEFLYWSDQIYKIWEVDRKTFAPTVDNFFDSVFPDDRSKFHLYTNKPVDQIDTQDIEYRIITKKGKLKWIHQFGKKIIDKDVLIFKGTIRDITDQKLQEEAIIEFNTKLQAAQKIAKLGYWEFDYSKENLTWSDQVYEIWETTKEDFEVTPERFYDTLYPDDKQRFFKNQEMALEGIQPMEVEHRIVLKNGKVKWVLERGELVANDQGNILFEGTVQDITHQKQIEIELREQNQFIKTAFDNLPIGIAVNSIKSGKVTLMNKNFSKIYGWPKKELMDLEGFFNKVYPDKKYREEMKAQIMRDIESGNSKRMNWEGVEITTVKGEKRLINAKNIPLYEQGLMISTVLDVTEKALAEQQLALSNERYEYVTKATFDAIWDWDIDRKNIFWGDGFRTIFGYNTGNTIEDLWYDNIHPDDLGRVKQSIKSIVQGNERSWESEYRFKHANGTYRVVKDRGIVLRNIEREAIRMIGAMQDITSQKEYEQKLLDVNQKLRNLSAHLQEAREEERISIAREIHDELGQQLTGIKLDVSKLKNKVETHFPEDSERIQRLIESINKTINDVRKIASHLRPGVLDDLGLEAAIEWQSNQFEEQTGIKCNLHFENVTGDYGKEINTSMYRIYQEALTNIMRHANATEVHTYFSEVDKTLVLEIIDNGVGINDADKNNTFSLGITGMRERALMINGSFYLQKQKQGGTKVKVTVPLRELTY